MRLFPVLAATLLLLPAACADDGVDKAASCADINEAITTLGTDPMLQNASGAANVQHFAETYSKTADRIRTAAAKASDPDVKNSATQIADALDLLTTSVTSATPAGPEGIKASTQLATAADTFQKTCGITPAAQ